jgi:hypothetical protein
MTFGLGNKRAGIGILGTIIVVIVVLVVLGWLGFYIR